MSEIKARKEWYMKKKDGKIGEKEREWRRKEEEEQEGDFMTN